MRPTRDVSRDVGLVARMLTGLVLGGGVALVGCAPRVALVDGSNLGSGSGAQIPRSATSTTEPTSGSLASSGVAMPTAAASAGRSASPPADQPDFEKVKVVLCEAADVGPSDCTPAAFEVHSTELNGDTKPEWVYVNKKGPAICFQRAACFTVLVGVAGAWRVAIAGMGEALYFTGQKHESHLDLVVAAANSACEMNATLFVWSGGSYRQGSQEKCRCDATSKSRVCSSLDREGVSLE